MNNINSNTYRYLGEYKMGKIAKLSELTKKKPNPTDFIYFNSFLHFQFQKVKYQ